MQEEKGDRLRVAVVGGGGRCLSILKMLESETLDRLHIEIIGVADVDLEAPGCRYARERGIFTTTDFRRLLDLDGIDLVMELTGDQNVLRALAAQKPDSVRLLNHSSTSLIEKTISLEHRGYRQEEEVRIGRSVVQAMINRINEGLMVLDRDHRILWINDQAVKQAGMTRDEALGRYCFQVSHQAISPCHGPDTPCPMKETLAQKTSAHSIHEHQNYEGQVHYCDVSTYPLLNRDGEVVQVVEILRDMTAELTERFERRTKALKEDLSRLVREDKLIALGKLVASVAHEINNPVSSIINFTKLILKSIREGRPTDEDLAAFERYLDLTVREAERCGKIVTNLLSFSRQKSAEAAEVNLIEVVDRIMVLMDHLMTLSGIETKVDFGPGPMEVWGDYNQLQQCLTNLVFNAIEAMSQGGTLTIRGASDEAKGLVTLKVSDTGHGIQPDHVPYIFEPFFSTKSVGSGVGLGLSMVYGIVRDHQGDIMVHSQPGIGTTFKIVFPSVSSPNLGD